MPSLSEVVIMYLVHYRTKDESLEWAWHYAEKATRNLEGGLSLCLALIEAAENDEELAYVAAGPVEDLLNRVGIPAIEAFEVPARRSLKVRNALAGVWLRPDAAAYVKWHALTQKYHSNS